jgi:hypothetical protein
MNKYEKVTSDLFSYVKRSNEDGTISAIPLDPANSDYQAYLVWVAEGNEEEETE